ncbi:hypothetical protein P280DRAFT_512122 [Massarina eburnea CBS 473.64]|uniref:Zn(2)-C6 fungal-type domain-containing protein n=1 Tax=Massarina eburnea CBS 473.64 TaxID=1395130 RepID=A0A6A6RGM8_9PLEO|nr:hypothetical protein P280DRAFT_512122 [Massarina eburnea CBS 473.64]
MNHRDSNGLGKAKRQCWACLKQRLVCDFTMPHCKKCVMNGRECPGYGDQKPLQWVPTGKVTSRRRRKEAPHTALLNAKIQEQATGCSVSESSSGDDVDEWAKRLAEEFENVAKKYRADNGLEETFTRTCRRSIEMVLTKKLQREATKLSRQDDDALGQLERMLRFMNLNELPAYELRSETCEVVQAVGYFNMRIYPQLIEFELAPNPHLIRFPVAALHLLPPAVHHNVVVMALSHFVYSLPPEKAKAIAAYQVPRILHHRGASIREISARLNGKMKVNDGIIVSIMMLMCCEFQQTDSSGWRQHAVGLQKVFELRGGMMDIYRNSLHLHPMIVLFVYIVTFANCCMPAHDQIMINTSLDEHLANIDTIVLKEGGDISPLCITAREILHNVDAFSPQDWAQPGASHAEWLTIGHLYKSSLAVYCIMAFQSLGLLPKTKTMDGERGIHADCLLVQLEAAVEMDKVKRFIAWPLIIASVEAAYRGEGARAWIERELQKTGMFMGVNYPSRMRRMLRTYWNSGVYGWEECFSQPQAFLF